MEQSYTESIEKWKESLIIEKEQIENDVDYYTKDISFSHRRLKVSNEALVICIDRITEADKILSDGKED